MTKYKYAAITPEGKQVSGTIDADHLNDARVSLADQGYLGLKVKERPSLLKTELTSKKVPRSELMNFSRQLSAFIRAGIPIIDAIDTLRAEIKHAKFRAVLADVSESLRGGETLSDAVSEHPEAFPVFYTTILESAELTGHIAEVLDQLASYIERDENARQKIRSALAYPIVVLVMAMVAVVVIAAFALPRFQTFFDSLDADLPLITRMLIAITDFLSAYWWALLLGLLVVALLLYLYGRTNAGRHTRDRLLLRVSVIGELVQYSIVERFCRILGSMITAGVQVPQAMAIATSATNNVIFQEGLETVRQALIEGEGMAGPIAATGLFPGGVVQMIRVGEETGTLDNQLNIAADFYGKEVGYKIDRMTALFEPALLIVVGVIVGFVAIALVSAMYGVFDQVKVH